MVTVESLQKDTSGSKSAPILLPNLLKHLSESLPCAKSHPLALTQNKDPSPQGSSTPSNQDSAPVPPSTHHQVGANPLGGGVSSTAIKAVLSVLDKNQQASAHTQLQQGQGNSLAAIKAVGPHPVPDKNKNPEIPSRSSQPQSNSSKSVKASGGGSLSSSELTQPVPLDTLLHHHVLEPGPQNLTCTILVSQYVKPHTSGEKNSFNRVSHCILL